MAQKRIWHIECNKKVIKCDPYKIQGKQHVPTLYFENEGRKFTVEFDNQTDFRSSEMVM